MARSRPNRVMVDLSEEEVEQIETAGRELAKRYGESKYLRVDGRVMLAPTIRTLLSLALAPHKIVQPVDINPAKLNDALWVLPEGMQVGTLTPEEAPDGEERWGFGGQGS